LAIKANKIFSPNNENILLPGKFFFPGGNFFGNFFCNNSLPPHRQPWGIPDHGDIQFPCHLRLTPISGIIVHCGICFRTPASLVKGVWLTGFRLGERLTTVNHTFFLVNRLTIHPPPPQQRPTTAFKVALLTWAAIRNMGGLPQHC
jgi:hypothetical protein